MWGNQCLLEGKNKLLEGGVTLRTCDGFYSNVISFHLAGGVHEPLSEISRLIVEELQEEVKKNLYIYNIHPNHPPQWFRLITGSSEFSYRTSTYSS